MPLAVIRRMAALLLLAALAGHAPPATAQPQTMAQSASPAALALPIFDAHLHYSANGWAVRSPEDVLAAMQRAGVARALASSSPDEGTRRLYAADDRRIVPSLRPYRDGIGPGTWAHDDATEAYLNERLHLGGNLAIGEVHLGSADDARGVAMQAALRLAGRTGLWLHVHADAEPLDALLAEAPRARILWAHAGLVTPVDQVRDLLERHPEVVADLSFREHTIVQRGALHPLWGQLLRDHPTRFVVGTDTYTADRLARYEELVAAHRAYLALLPLDVAEAIAWRNAVRLFGDGGLPALQP